MEPSPRVIEAVPVGQVGDGAIRVRYDPDPPHNRSKFEVEYAWDGSNIDVDTVYAGDVEHAAALIEALAEAIRLDQEAAP